MEVQPHSKSRNVSSLPRSTRPVLPQQHREVGHPVPPLSGGTGTGGLFQVQGSRQPAAATPTGEVVNEIRWDEMRGEESC
jgi:hypothetical protein